MDSSMVTVISILVGILVLGGGALVVYVSSLARTAYDLRVTLQSDLETGLVKIEDELVKNGRFMKRDLAEEIEKSRSALEGTLSKRALDDVAKQAAFLKELEARMEAQQLQLANLARDIQGMGQSVAAVRRSVQASEARLAASQPTITD